MRSEKSIERADICALVVDAVDGVTAQDKKIAGLIQENEKPCLVVVNKLDLVKPSNRVRDFRGSGARPNPFQSFLSDLRTD